MKKKDSKLGIIMFLSILLMGFLILDYNLYFGNSTNMLGQVTWQNLNSAASPTNTAGQTTTTPVQCADHLDNDNNGYCDYRVKGAYCSDGSTLGDPGCISKSDSAEKTVCLISTEICDNKDNDCDTLIDESLTKTTTCGIGECTSTGIETCNAGIWSANTCVPLTPNTEVCNDAKDNNCDGTTDEGCANLTNPPSPTNPPNRVIGYLVYWDKQEGLNTIMNTSVFTEISPWAYVLNSKGEVITDPLMTTSIVDSSTINLLRSKGIKIVPTIPNLVGYWDAELVHGVISNSTLITTHITKIINLVNSNGYDGIDIDYENLYAEDRVAFSNFITRLANRLHAYNKTLSVVVYGKVDEPGWWSGPQAQDYAVLGSVSDEIRIMYYQFDASQAGTSQAPIWWIQQSLDFAKTKMPANKIVTGIDLGGIDWTSTQSTTYTWREINTIRINNNAAIQWDATNQEPYFTYPNHQVRFANPNSTAYRVTLSKQKNVNNFFFWRLGKENPNVWSINFN